MADLTTKPGSILQKATPWWPLLAALVGIGVLYLPALLAPSAGAFHDDGIYLVTAKSLAEGDGYRILSLPSEAAQTKYPFLFPVALAAVWKLLPDFPANLPALRLLTLFWAAVWCRFAYLVIRREAGSVTASTVVVLTLCSPWVLFLATTPLSETMFAALLWGSLFELSKYESETDEAAGKRWLLLAALLAGAATVTRVLGATLIGAVLITLLARRRARHASLFAGVSGILVLPWIGWTLFAAGSGADGYYSAANYSSWNVVTNFPWVEKATVLGHNLLLFLLTPGYLFGLFDPRTIPLMLVIGALVLIGLIARLRAGPGILEVFFGTYVLALLIWPWPPIRFLAPLYPLLLLFAWHGVLTISRLPHGSGTRLIVLQRVTAGFAILLAATNLAATGTSVAGSGMIVPAPQCQDDWAEFEQVIAWIEENTPPDAVLASNLDPLLFLYTGRKAVRPFEANPVELYYLRRPEGEPLGPPTELARRLNGAGADYVITTPGTCFREKQHLERQLVALSATDGPVAIDGLVVEEIERFSSETRVLSVRPTDQDR